MARGTERNIRMDQIDLNSTVAILVAAAFPDIRGLSSS
ncbi:hypothetical protein GGD53_001299 [Rhizobium aethiopicum]|uniref:Uncharacterized protein n=1 Tax=Rhizobium aethiopicum TaxID=1138170 RepID=A0A7W6MFD9_9HYPH|nr:hypothetical protein [Rhizobium aethiopicum]